MHQPRHLIYINTHNWVTTVGTITIPILQMPKLKFREIAYVICFKSYPSIHLEPEKMWSQLVWLQGALVPRPQLICYISLNTYGHTQKILSRNES